MIFKLKITLKSLFLILYYVKNFIYRIYRIKFDNIIQLFNYSIYSIVLFNYF